MFATLCARSKILQIIEPGKAFRITVNGSIEEGSHVDLNPSSDVTEFDSTISIIPLIVIDIQTATLLAGQSIDFDYDTEEFIISRS